MVRKILLGTEIATYERTNERTNEITKSYGYLSKMVLTNFKHFKVLPSSLWMWVSIIHCLAWVTHTLTPTQTYSLTQTFTHILKNDQTHYILFFEMGTENSDGDRKSRHTHERTNSLNLVAI